MNNDDEKRIAAYPAIFVISFCARNPLQALHASLAPVTWRGDYWDGADDQREHR